MCCPNCMRTHGSDRPTTRTPNESTKCDRNPSRSSTSFVRTHEAEYIHPENVVIDPHNPVVTPRYKRFTCTNLDLSEEMTPRRKHPMQLVRREDVPEADDPMWISLASMSTPTRSDTPTIANTEMVVTCTRSDNITHNTHNDICPNVVNIGFISTSQHSAIWLSLGMRMNSTKSSLLQD
jgi:hypothetical protein